MVFVCGMSRFGPLPRRLSGQVDNEEGDALAGRVNVKVARPAVRAIFSGDASCASLPAFSRAAYCLSLGASGEPIFFRRVRIAVVTVDPVVRECGGTGGRAETGGGECDGGVGAGEVVVVVVPDHEREFAGIEAGEGGDVGFSRTPVFIMSSRETSAELVVGGVARPSWKTCGRR